MSWRSRARFSAVIKKLVLLWAISAGALMLLPVVFGDGVNITDWKVALIAAVVVGVTTPPSARC